MGRGGRDYTHDLHNISECNPFGLQGRRSRCNLVKNTELPEQSVEILPNGGNKGFSIEGSLAYVTSKHYLKITAPWMGFKIYKWSTSNIGPGTFEVIDGGRANDNYIEIRTLSSDDTDYQLSVEVTDQKTTITDINIFTNIVEFIDIPIVIESLLETIAGSCSFMPSGTCEAVGEYSVEYINDTGDVTYEWSVIGDDANLVDNLDGTATVTTTLGYTSTFVLTVKVSDTLSEDTISQSFTHERTEMTEIIDQELLYDATNIATEFI